MDAYLKKVFGSAYEQAKLVIFCESGSRHDAVSPTSDYGYFQINAVHFKNVLGDTREEKIANLFNPYYNIDFAFGLYQKNRWADWNMSYNCHRLK